MLGSLSLDTLSLLWAKPRRYGINFQLQNDGRTTLRVPQCASPCIAEILLNTGASFELPIFLYGAQYRQLCPPVITGLPEDYHNQYIDDINEYSLDMLSRDVATLDCDQRYSLSLLLTEICCGRSPELWDTWRQAHGLPAYTVFSPDSLVDKIASTISLQGWPGNADIIYAVLNTVFRTGDIHSGNEILSLFVTRCPGFSVGLGRAFSWEQVEMRPPVYFLDKKGSGIQELLEGHGADRNCIMYYTMASVPDIAYWEEVLGKGVDNKVLNSLLLFSAASCPTGHAEFLLSKGASVHFQSCFAGEYHRSRTALAYATWRSNMEMIVVLLKHGADVLQEFVQGDGKKFTISELVGPSHPDIARMLAQVEREERAKRGIAHSLSLLNLFALCLIGGVC